MINPRADYDTRVTAAVKTQSGEQGALFSVFKMVRSCRKEENLWVEISFTQSVLSRFGTLQSIGRLLCVDMGERLPAAWRGERRCVRECVTRMCMFRSEAEVQI